jgi:hypothetical protein
VPQAMFFAYLASALAIMLTLIFAFKVEERFSVTGLATLALAVATIFLAWDAHQQLPILSGQLDEMKKAYDPTTKAVGVAENTANAAIEANNLTRQTFAAGQRPWVFYDYLATKIASPLILDTENGGRMELEFSVRNTGKTIARNTAIYAAISFLGSKHADRVAEQKGYCDMIKFFTTPFNAMTISPDKAFSRGSSRCPRLVNI